MTSIKMPESTKCVHIIALAKNQGRRGRDMKKYAMIALISTCLISLCGCTSYAEYKSNKHQH